MGFPNDLTNVVVFKIHPAIGVARISDSDDFFVFGTDPTNYKANGRLKKQAVQFRIFAYGENHVGLGELTADVMANLGITAVWSAKVANRKIAHYKDLPLSTTDFVTRAEASSDINAGRLIGSQPTFAEGAEIPLGQITSTGLFVPPKASVHRQTAGQPLPDFPARGTTVADTTSDGVVAARLTGAGAQLEVLPACIIVTAPDLSPDVNPGSNLLDFLREQLGVVVAPPGNLHNQVAMELDEAALRPATAIFDPGIEACLADERSEVVDVTSIFYQSDQDPRIDPREMRLRYKSPGQPGPGAVPGQLTSGLCSPWQGDYTACVGYWPAHLPPRAFLDENTQTEVRFFRKRYTDQTPGAETLKTPEDFDNHIEKMGVVRLRNARLVETEREPGDDAEDLIG
jgi:hypothetical protein